MPRGPRGEERPADASGIAAHIVRIVIMLALVLVVPGTTARAGDSRHDDSSGRHVSALIALLRSPDPQTRRNAASALSRVKPLPPDAIPAVTQALKDSDSTVQALAVRALANGGAVAIPALKALLEDKEPRNLYARRAVIGQLSRMAKTEPAAWPVLVGALDDPNLQQWPVLLDAFADPDQDHGERPSIELAKIGSPVVPMLRRALLDKNLVVRRGAVAALQMAPGAAKDATPELIATLRDSDPSVRELAAMDLGRIGAPARSALPALAEALNDPSTLVEAAVAMARIDPTDKAPVPTLIDALEREGLSVQQMDAVHALATMGSNARAAAPALEHLLAPDPYTRPRAEYAKALRSIEGVDAVPVLTEAMTEGKDAGVRLAAMKAIAAIGPGATVAIPALVRALSDPDQNVREAAADTLATFGDRAKPALLTALHSPDLYTREEAIRALGKAKPLPDDVARALSAAAYDDKSASVRYEAANVLDRAGVKPERAQWSQVEQDSSEAMSESPEADTRRTYRRQEVLADISPDNNSEYPLQLTHLLTLNGGKVLAAVYRGRDHQSDRLIFWRECGNDCYRQIEANDAGESVGGGTFDPPKEIFISGAQYVGVGENVWRNGWVDFFRIHGDEVQRAEIKPPGQWDRDKLRPGGESANQSQSVPSNVDTKRLYSRQEMFADLAPEDSQGHPLRLVYLLSFYGDQMLAAVYRGPGHADRLIFWRQSGKDRYQKMQMIDAGQSLGSGTFDPPRETSLVSMNGYPGGWLVDVGVKVQRAHWDHLFREGDELRPVEIESAEEWYGYRLQPGEAIVGPSESWFSNGDGEARFSLKVRSGGKTNRLAGTYKLVEPSGIGGHMSFVYPGIAKVESPESEEIWKLVPNSARIEPLRSH